jgi:hypothetical protein
MDENDSASTAKQYFGIGPFISCLVLVQTYTPHTTIYLFIFQFCFHCLWHVLFAKWPKHEWENYEWCVYYSSFVCVYKTYSASVQQQKRLLFVWSFRVYGLCVCVRIETPRITHFIPRFLTSTFLSHTHLPQKMHSTTPFTNHFTLMHILNFICVVAWSIPLYSPPPISFFSRRSKARD